MLPEISLNVLDIVQNSISAEATLIEIDVLEYPETNLLQVRISDNGFGMDEEALQAVIDPFFTTRTTRKVGLGIPFFKQEAEATGGNFSIESKKGSGTTVKAEFVSNHIDCMPLGDMNATIHSLVTMNDTIDFVYRRMVGEQEFTLDTRQFREILGDVPFHTAEVSEFIRQYLEENESELKQM